MLSLTKLHTSDNVITKNKSFINILKRKGPKIEPSGLFEEPIFVLCFQRERESRVNDSPILSIP